MTAQPTPELLNATGHALLLAVATGHSGPLQAAVGALDRLVRLLPDASAESRLTAVLMSLSSEPSPQAETMVQSPTPTSQSQPARRTSKADRPTRKSKAATPRMDSSGKLLPSREIDGIAVVSQAEARKALGVSCVQMLRLEAQKVLVRVRDGGMRHVYYPVEQVQRLLDLLDATPPPPL
jgi:hypothetical protein